MRTYLIILSNITSVECDKKFADYVNKNKFDFWRYTSLNWILLTPDDISTNMINTAVIQAYGVGFICCMEIKINDVAGIFPTNNPEAAKSGWSPFNWFNQIKSTDFIPRWKREDATDKV